MEARRVTTTGPADVVLTITDPDDPGRFAALPMGRARAEAIIAEGLTLWPRHEFRIDPIPIPEERTLIQFLKVAEIVAAVVRFVVRFVLPHKELVAIVSAGLVALFLALLAIHLPSAHLRVFPVYALALVSFFAGFFSPRVSGV
jgi:hypothetical protein